MVLKLMLCMCDVIFCLTIFWGYNQLPFLIYWKYFATSQLLNSLSETQIQ